jgi:hypothetical protein
MAVRVWTRPHALHPGTARKAVGTAIANDRKKADAQCARLRNG